MAKNSPKRAPKYLEVTVKVPVELLVTTAKDAGCKATKRQVYDAMVKNSKAISQDLVDVWAMQNGEDDAEETLMGLFGEDWLEKHTMTASDFI